MNVKKRFHIARWIYLSFAVLLNGFIIMHACLPGSVSAKWSNAFVTFFVRLFNAGNNDTSRVIKVDDVTFLLDKDYKYNTLEGYEENEIPLGTSKRYLIDVSPSDASNKAVKYMASDPTSVSINQIGNYLYITALKSGVNDVTLSSESDDTKNKTITIKGVEKKAPITYTYLDNIEVYEGGVVDFHLTSNDSYLDSYYDFSKLDINFSSSSFVHLKDQLFIASISGNFLAYINEHEVNIKVNNKEGVIYPEFDSLNIKEEITSGESASSSITFFNNPTSKEVFYDVDDASLASVDKQGVLTIKEGIKEEKEVVLTAYSKLDPNYKISKNIKIKPVKVQDFELVLDYYGTHINDMPLLGEITQTIKIWYYDDSYHIYEEGIIVTSSVEEVAKVYVQGHAIFINCLKEGSTHITVTSVNNPNVSHYLDLEVTIKGVINYENYQSFSEFVRKSIGHFLLFLASGVFTFLTLYTFLYDKKKYFTFLISIGIGLVIAITSEVIQHFIPSRFGSVIDVLTDFGGFVLGALIVLVIIILIIRNRNKKENKEKINKKD